MTEIERNFVTFYSPGTFVNEETTKEIASWDVEAAKTMAREVSERYAAKPFGFRFSTRGRTEKDLDSHVLKSSPLYWLGGKIETRGEIEARNDPTEDILRRNMRSNNIERVIVNSNSWKHTAPLGKDDVVLEWTP